MKRAAQLIVTGLLACSMVVCYHPTQTEVFTFEDGPPPEATTTDPVPPG